MEPAALRPHHRKAILHAVCWRFTTFSIYLYLPKLVFEQQTAVDARALAMWSLWNVLLVLAR